MSILVTSRLPNTLYHRFVASDVAQARGLHNMVVERVYHTTAHAKGRQDGYGGVFKTLVRNAVDREDRLLNTPELIEEYMKVKCYLLIYILRQQDFDPQLK